jgi:hypothetical protein
METSHGHAHAKPRQQLYYKNNNNKNTNNKATAKTEPIQTQHISIENIKYKLSEVGGGEGNL